MKVLFLLSLVLFLNLTSTFAQTNSKKDVKVVYKYKKYQKFDFEDLVIEGDSGDPGDLSTSPAARVKVINKLPERLNFNQEIRKGIERLR